MKRRVSFGSKDQRYNQRRPVTVAATLGGIRVELSDLSFTGSGGRIADFDGAGDLPLAEGAVATLDFAGPDGRRVSLQAAIQRLDKQTGRFGLTFSDLSDSAFNAIEKLMFPLRRRR